MSIAMAIPLPIGNAIRVTLERPSGTMRTRVLRRSDVDFFTGPSDPDAVVAWEGDAVSFVDADAANSTPYWYKPYHLIANAWVEAPSVLAQAAATYEDQSVDSLSIVLDRVAKGIAIEVARGELVHAEGLVPVLSAPPVFDEKRLPLVSVHLQSAGSGDRFLGELYGTDRQTDSLDWNEAEGWLERDTLQIIAWCLNPDVRIAFRKALRRILIGNLAVFDAMGMLNVDISFSDVEDFESYGAPVYQVMCTLTCNAPVAVGSVTNAIDDVEVVGTATGDSL